MDRRDFIKKIGGTAAILTVVPGAIIASRVSTGMSRPLPVKGTMVSRETISSVERSVIQSRHIMIETGKLGMENFHKALQEKLEAEKILRKSFRKEGKLQYYEQKEFF